MLAVKKFHFIAGTSDIIQGNLCRRWSKICPGRGEGVREGGGGGTDENTSRSRNSSKLMWKPSSCGEHSEPAVAPDGCPESQHLTDNGGLLKPKVVVTHTAPLTSSAVKDLHCTFVDAVGAVQIQTNWVSIVDGGNCVGVCVCVCVCVCERECMCI